jgi:hypothetical protein
MERSGYFFAIVEEETAKKAFVKAVQTFEWVSNFKAYIIKNPNLNYSEDEALALMFFDVKNVQRRVCRCYSLGTGTYMFFAKKTEHYTLEDYFSHFKQIRQKVRISNTLSEEDIQVLEYVGSFLERKKNILIPHTDRT